MQHQHMTQHGPGVPAYHNIACHTTQQSLASLYGTTMHSFKKTRSSGLSQFRDIAVQAAQFWQRSSGELHTRFSSDSEHARSSGKSQSHTHHPLPPLAPLASVSPHAIVGSRLPTPHTPNKLKRARFTRDAARRAASSTSAWRRTCTWSPTSPCTDSVRA